MTYRNGTYIAFHADGISDQSASDIKYYRLLKAWHENDNVNFRFVNSHEKTSAVRDSSQKETLRRSLQLRMNNSKNMVLIIGDTTRFDTDWVPYEIVYAIERCKIPIIAAYTGYEVIANPAALWPLWPTALFTSILSNKAHVAHIPFKRAAIDHLIRILSPDLLPPGGLSFLTPQTRSQLGLS